MGTPDVIEVMSTSPNGRRAQFIDRLYEIWVGQANARVDSCEHACYPIAEPQRRLLTNKGGDKKHGVIRGLYPKSIFYRSNDIHTAKKK